MGMENQNGSVEWLSSMGSTDLRNFLGTLVNNLQAYERMYTLLKGNYFENAVRKALLKKFNGNKSGYTAVAEGQFVDANQELIANSNVAIDQYKKTKALAEQHEGDGFSASLFWLTCCIGAGAYFFIHFGRLETGLFRLIMFIIAAILGFMYFGGIQKLCAQDYSGLLNRHYRNALNASDALDNSKDKYVKNYLDSAWRAYLKKPENSRLMEEAAANTRETANEFETVSQQVHRLISVLPPKYRYSNVIQALYEIMLNGEASSWSECTKLYLENVRHEETMSKISGLEAQMNRVIANQQDSLNNQAEIMRIQQESVDQINANIKQMSSQINTNLNDLSDQMGQGFRKVITGQREQMFQTMVIGERALSKMDQIHSAVLNSRPVVYNNYYPNQYTPVYY